MMEQENLIPELLKCLPKLKPLYEEELEWMEEVLPHYIFGSVVTSYTVDSLNNNIEESKELFRFFNEMAVGDEYVQNVLVVSLLEPLITERDIIDQAKLLMSETTKQLCEEMERAYGYL